MKLTNIHNLPQPFVDAVSVDTYSKGDSDYSTTGLIRPPLISALEKKHWDDITEDVIDRVYRLTGQAKHIVLERAASANPDYIVEQRFSTQVGKYKISGQLDLYDKTTRTLYDWKETSVWKEIMGDKKDWISQGNINRYILEMNDIPVEKIVYIVFYRDWKKNESFKNQDYPPARIGSYDFGELWELDKTDAFILERARLHEKALTEEVLCTDEEKWTRPEQFAVIKGDNKRASFVFDTEAEAQAWLGSKSGYRIEHRPAEYRRCQEYCLVSEFCSWWKDNRR